MTRLQKKDEAGGGASDLQEYFSKLGNFELRDMARKGRGWFRSKVAELRSVVVSPRKFITEEDVVRRLTVGRVYIYRYLPKHMATLPIWDEYPLVLPFRATETGFIGINLHYLPCAYRAMLLDKLTRMNPRVTDRKRMIVSWSILEKMSRINVGEMATHQYLLSHIATPIRLIRVEDYAKMILLPVQKFHGNQERHYNRLV